MHNESSDEEDSLKNKDFSDDEDYIDLARLRREREKAIEDGHMEEKLVGADMNDSILDIYTLNEKSLTLKCLQSAINNPLKKLLKSHLDTQEKLVTQEKDEKLIGDTENYKILKLEDVVANSLLGNRLKNLVIEMKKMKIKPNSENNSYYQFNPAQPNEIPTFVQYSNSTKRPTTRVKFSMNVELQSQIADSFRTYSQRKEEISRSKLNKDSISSDEDIFGETKDIVPPPNIEIPKVTPKIQNNQKKGHELEKEILDLFQNKGEELSDKDEEIIESELIGPLLENNNFYSKNSSRKLLPEQPISEQTISGMHFNPSKFKIKSEEEKKRENKFLDSEKEFYTECFPKTREYDIEIDDENLGEKVETAFKSEKLAEEDEKYVNQKRMNFQWGQLAQKGNRKERRKLQRDVKHIDKLLGKDIKVSGKRLSSEVGDLENNQTGDTTNKMMKV